MNNNKEFQNYIKRLKGVISPEFHKKAILVIGVGAGSYAVEKLARLCPAKIIICDFDIVEIHNLSRTAYTYKDAENSLLKVEALSKRIKNINPFIEVEPISKSFTEISPEEIENIIQDVSIIIEGTDYFPSKVRINELSVKNGIPAVYIGFHAAALGGRIIYSIPGITPCYRCIAKERYETAEQNSDAGKLNLTGELGSVIDCQFIDMLAMKICTAVLERGQDSIMGRFYNKMISRNEVIVRCDPEYEWGNILWDALLGDLPKQPKDYAKELREQALFAMDSIWLRTDYDPECPVCKSIQNINN